MKQFLTLLVLLSISIFLSAQNSTMREVYDVFQSKCVQCHGNDNPVAFLDLEGTLPTMGQRIEEVFNNLYEVTPQSEYAAEKGYKLVYPGRPDLSFLFRKIEHELEPTIEMAPEEGQRMPAYGANADLVDKERELVRQWILYGAKPNGVLVNKSLIDEYYDIGGLESFPEGAPAAPAEGEGFQVKMGPFFIEPSGEVEYFQKYETMLSQNLEVNRFDIKMGTYSHHYIAYKYNSPSDAANNPAGLRLQADHSNTSLIAAVQQPTDLMLPQGTAFFWNAGEVIDLNSHYINYSPTSVYKAEAYVNIYTQDSGTASQEMESQLLPNLDIVIPNTGDQITYEQALSYPFGEIFIWAVGGHTHQYGTGSKVYERLSNGEKGELIYDGACPEGVPGCVSPYFDYQHIPFRYFEPLNPVQLNPGFIHEATWVNDGPETVYWGDTSEDEMMVLIIMYTLDTAGVTTGFQEIIKPVASAAAPNPMSEQTLISLPIDFQATRLEVFDITGKSTSCEWQVLGSGQVILKRGNLPEGIFFYKISDKNGYYASGKILISD